MEKRETEADAIAALGVKAAGVPHIVNTENGQTFLVMPEGYEFHDATLPNAVSPIKPHIIDQAVTIQTAQSMVDYVNRFKTDNTVLLADVDANKIVAVIDYHAPDQAEFGKHIATLLLPYSVEWKTWTAVDKVLTPQLEFARFLEENGVDVRAPAGADLLEVCRDLQAIRRVDFKKAVRTETDNESFEYSDETETRAKGGTVEVPTKFQLGLPVYFGDSETTLFAFLRHKLDGKDLLLGIALHRTEQVRQAVFRQHVLDIAARTDRPVIFGRI